MVDFMVAEERGIMRQRFGYTRMHSHFFKDPGAIVVNRIVFDRFEHCFALEAVDHLNTIKLVEFMTI